MKTSLKSRLNGNFHKNTMVRLLKEEPAYFDEAVHLAVHPEEKIAWRAAWLLYHAMTDYDPRLLPHRELFVAALPGKDDGHQRELLKIIERLDPDEDLLGELFDICVNIWKQVGKSPSVRIVAFRVLYPIAQGYPELMGELDFLLQEHYTQSLSPGIKHSLQKILDGGN